MEIKYALELKRMGNGIPLLRVHRKFWSEVEQLRGGYLKTSHMMLKDSADLLLAYHSNFRTTPCAAFPMGL